MARDGASLVLADIDAAGLEEAAGAVRAAQGKVLTVPCDVQDRAQVDGLIQLTKRELGRVDILVNNAGLLLPGHDRGDHRRHHRPDPRHQREGDPLRHPGGDAHHEGPAVRPIVNIASITGKSGDNSTVFVYGASKGAVISLTRSVARQLGPFGVTCNAIAPHAVMTEMMRYWSDEKKKKIADSIPVRRLGTVEDMAHLICFLASDDASFINGETVNINGGYYMD